MLVDPCDRVEAQGCVAMVHDLLTGPLPREFDRCDVFYTDLPWRAGFKVFERRAGKTGRVYLELMRALGLLVTKLWDRPMILIGGKTELRHLPPCRSERTILNGDRAIAAIYGQLPAIDYSDSWEIQRGLARHYQCVGDFCCGYGRVGRIFRRAGRRFVMSDYNARCIGFIATWLKDK